MSGYPEAHTEAYTPPTTPGMMTGMGHAAPHARAHANANANAHTSGSTVAAHQRRRQTARSPKRLVREQVGIVHGPIIGCEYKAVGRQVATAGFELSSEARGFLEPGDIVFPVEARPSRGRWRLRLSLGQGREVWVSELAEDGTPLLEMVTASAALLDEGQPPMRIPDVEEPSVSTTPAERQLPTSPARRPGLSSSSPPRLRRDSDREDQESVMNEAISQSLALGFTGRHAVANFLPLRDFLRQEVHRLCEAVQDAEKQAEEEIEKRQTLEQQLNSSQQTKDLLQSEMSIKVQAAEAAAAQEKQRRESLQSQLRELQQDEGSLRLKLRDEIAHAERKAEAERLEREAVQARLAEVQAAERRSREELGRDVLAAQARADEERRRRETMEEQIETAKAEQDKRAVRLRDAVAYAESQLMRERNSREDLERQLSDQQQQDAERRNAALVAVAKAESAAAAEREEREQLQRTLEHAQAENERHAAELRTQISRAEQDALAERRDRQAKDRELQTVKSTHEGHVKTLRAKLAEAEKLHAGEKKLRESIELSIADARHLSRSDVADLEDKLQQAKRDIESEQQRRQSAEERLERVSAEEKERAANLSQMLQVLSNEVRAARAEVETLRSSANTTRALPHPEPQPSATPAVMAALETWIDHTGVHVDLVDNGSGSVENPSQAVSPDQGDPILALSQLQETHETLRKDADTLKQRLVSALQENHAKSEKLKEERAKRQELRAEMERKIVEEVAAAKAVVLTPRTPPRDSQAAAPRVDRSDDGAAVVDATVTAMLAAAEETAVMHHDQLADEITAHMTEHAAQQALADERLLQRLRISGDALAQAVDQCKVANETAKGLQARLRELTRERDDALQEVIEFKRDLETSKANATNPLRCLNCAKNQQAGSEEPGQGHATAQATAVNESMLQLETERSKWQQLCQECQTEISLLRQQLQESQNSVGRLTAERDALKEQVDLRVAPVEDDKFADTDFSPAKSRELRREIRELRDVAATRKQQLDQRVDELARLEAGREKYAANLAEKDDEIQSLKEFHAQEVRTLHDQLMAKQDKYAQHEREQQERYASGLAEAEVRAAAAWEERDRANAGRAEERAKAEERLRHATENHHAAVALSDTLVAELDKWVNLSQQSALREAVVSSSTSPSANRHQLSGLDNMGTLSPIGANSDAETSIGLRDRDQGRVQSLVPASPVESAASEYGGWMSPTPTTAIVEEQEEGEEEEEEEEVEEVARNGAELTDTLAGLYRLGSGMGLDQVTIDDALNAFEDDIEACYEYLIEHGAELAAELALANAVDPSDVDVDATLNVSLE